METSALSDWRALTIRSVFQRESNAMSQRLEAAEVREAKLLAQHARYKGMISTLDERFTAARKQTVLLFLTEAMRHVYLRCLEWGFCSWGCVVICQM